MLLFLVGLLAIVCQIVLLRELNVASYGVELIYALALAAWMLAGGIGAAWRSRGRVVSSAHVAWLLVAAALALPLDVAFVRGSRVLLGGVPGAFLPLDQQLLVVTASLAPISSVLGLAFRHAAQAAAVRGRPLATSYAIESAGAVAGAAAATLALVAGMQTLALAILAAGSVAAALLFVPLRTPTLAAACLVAMSLGAALSPLLDLSTTRWTQPATVETRDSPYARITASASGGQTVLVADDVLVFESESSQQEELADLAALMHPDPRRILLLGGTVQQLEPELRRHHPERIASVEMDRVFYEVASRWLRLDAAPTFDDPRDYLRRRHAAYDLIVVAMPEPTSGQSNRFYTSEFFAECRRRLAPGGVLAFKLAVPENVITPLLAMRTASIVGAVRSAFPRVELLQGASALVFASAAPLPDSPDLLVERWRARGLATRLVTPAYIRYLFENDRRARLNRIGSMAVDPNSDARPICYAFTAVNWLAKFYPDLLRVDPAMLAGGTSTSTVVGFDGRPRASIPPTVRDPRYLGVAILVVALLLARRRATLRVTLLAGLAGLVGMLLEIVLLLVYQSRSGALYERLGILLMAFMAGLTLGAWIVARIAAPGRGVRVVRWSTATSLVVLALIAGATAVLTATGAGMNLVETGLLLLLGGAAVGGIFACAAAASEVMGGGAIGRLYGADLAGGALGSLVASLLLVPLAGLVPTAWLVVGLGAAALLLV
jgi:spermidine synthase